MSKPTVISLQGSVIVESVGILADLRELIQFAHRRVAMVADTEQTLLYWQLGK